MSSAYSVACDLELLSTADGGLSEPMSAPTPSLLLVFANLDPEGVGEDFQIGVMISGLSALVPGASGPAELTFWDDLGRLYATPGAPFKLWYAGRIVGFGRVASDETGAEL